MARGGMRVQILSEFDPKGFERARKEAEGFSNQMRELAKTAAAAFATRQVVNFAKSAVDAASDLGESVNAVAVTFGEAADGILALGENASTSFGLSRQEFNAFAVQFSGFTQQIAGAGGDVIGVTEELTTRIADFASVLNLDVAEAAQVFQSSLAGETEPIRRFGYDLSAAAVEAHALATGMISSKSEMTEAIKVQARYSLLMESTSKVAGDFQNTIGSLANQQRVLTADFADARATIGEAMIPAFQGMLNVVTPLLDAFTALPKDMQGLIGVTALLAVGLRAASTTLQGFGVSARYANTAMGVLGIALYAGTNLLNAYNTQKAEATRISEGFRQALDAESDGVQNATRQYTLNELTAGRLGEAITDLGLNFNDVADFIHGESVPAIEEFMAATDKYSDSAEAAQIIIDKLGLSTEANAADISIASAAIAKLSDGFQTASTDAGRFDDAMQDANDAVTNGVIAATHYAEAMQVTNGALIAQKDATEALITARQLEEEQLMATAEAIVFAAETAGYGIKQTNALVDSLGVLDGLTTEVKIELGLLTEFEEAIYVIDGVIQAQQRLILATGGTQFAATMATLALIDLKNELIALSDAPAPSTGGGGGGFGLDADQAVDELNRFVDEVVRYGNTLLGSDFADRLFDGTAESIADTFDSVMMELAALSEQTTSDVFDRVISTLADKFRDLAVLADLRDELREQLEGIREVQQAARDLFATGLEVQTGDDALSLREQLAQRVQQARDFVKNIGKLQRMGFPAEIINDVVNAGLVDGAAMAAELATFKPTEVATLSAQVVELRRLQTQAGDIVGGLLGAPAVEQALSTTEAAMANLTSAIQTDLYDAFSTFLTGLGQEVDRLTNPTAGVGGGSVIPNRVVVPEGQAINVTVNAGVGTDGTQVGRQIVEILNEYAAGGGSRLSSSLVGG